jgi:hypothetical protein
MKYVIFVFVQRDTYEAFIFVEYAEYFKILIFQCIKFIIQITMTDF